MTNIDTRSVKIHGEQGEALQVQQTGRRWGRRMAIGIGKLIDSQVHRLPAIKHGAYCISSSLSRCAPATEWREAIDSLRASASEQCELPYIDYCRDILTMHYMTEPRIPKY